MVFYLRKIKPYRRVVVRKGATKGDSCEQPHHRKILLVLIPMILASFVMILHPLNGADGFLMMRMLVIVKFEVQINQ